MTTLTATAIISAIDRASPVFAKVGAQAAAAARVYGGMAQQINQAGRAVATNFSAPALLGIGAVIARTQDFEKAVAGVRIAGIADNLKDGVVDFKKLREEADKTQEAALKISEALRLSPTGIIKAGEAAGKMGLAGDKANKLMEMAGSVHVQDREMSPEKAAEFIGTMGILYNAGKEREYGQDITKLTNQWLAVANMTRTSASRIEGGLRQFAPLYASLGEDFAHTSALVGAMVQGGLTDIESGTALKSLAVRMLKPTRDGMDAMRIAGIDRAKFMNLEPVSARKAFANLKAITDQQVGKKDWAPIQQMLQEGEAKKSFLDPEWQQSFLQAYNTATKANTQEARDANAERMALSLLAGGGKIRMYDLIKEFGAKLESGELTNQGMAQIGEGRHLSRYKALFKLIPEAEKLLGVLKGINNEMTGSGNKIWRESAAGQWEGMVAAIDRMLTRIRETKGFGGLVSGLESIATAMDRMAKTNPDTLNAIVTGLLAFAGLGAAGAVIGMLASGLGTIAAALASPAMVALLAGGGLAAMLGAFNVENGQAVVNLLSAVAGAVGQISGGIGDAVSGLQSLLNMNPSEGAGLAALLNGMAANINLITAGLRTIREASSSPSKHTGDPYDPMGMADAQAGRQRESKKAVDDVAGLLFPWLKKGHEDLNKQPLIREQSAPFANGVPFWPPFVPNPLSSLQGTVTGEVTSKVVVEVKGPGQVVENQGGTGKVNGSLNSGKSMPDVGAGKQ